jgi:Na+/proline symporter
MILVGLWGMKKTTTLSDFFLGGRSIGPWVSAMAYGTTYFSAVMFIGFAGKLGWGYGLNVMWIALGNAIIGAFLSWIVLGKRTRRMTQNLNVMTMPEFLHERYNAKYFKIFAAIVIFIFLLPYSASVFKGLSYLFQINFNIPYEWALLIIILITGIYLVLGGYFAITMTDFIQGFIMFIGAIVMIAFLLSTQKAGGVVNAISTIIAEYPKHVPAGKQPGILLLLSLVFMTSFGTWGLPQMVQKFYAIKDEKFIFKAAIVTSIFALVIASSAYFNGALTHIYFDKYDIAIPKTINANYYDSNILMKAKSDTEKEILNKSFLKNESKNVYILNNNLSQQDKDDLLKVIKDAKIDNSYIYDTLIPDMLNKNLPVILMSLMLLLVLSASMSTLSSLILVSASSIAIDLYKGHINPKLKKENSVMMMRFLSAIFIIFSYFIATYKITLIITLMSLSWGVVAGTFMAAYIYGLYWKKTTKGGAFAGMLTGFVLGITLFFVMGEKNAPIASSIAIIVPFIVVPIVSLFTKSPKEELINKAFEGISKD